MSADSRVAIRYAKSVVSLAEEKGLLETVKKDIDSFIEICEGSRDLRLLLKSPIVSADKKFKVLTKLFGKDFDTLLMTFFEIVCRKGRESLLESIASQIVSEYNKIKGVQFALLTSATSITATQRDTFVAMVQEMSGLKEVDLKEEVDADLIGGFILRVGDKRVDSSVKSNLQKLKLKLQA